MKAIGILVCFYPQYKCRALKVFSKLMKLVSPHDNHILVVDNSVDSQAVAVKDVMYDSIVGSNAGWEFSAWDEAVEHLKCIDRVDDDTIFVFANDTFCHNRVFSFISLITFAIKIRKNCVKDNALVGELCRLDNAYKVGGLVSNGWISTYLFACGSKVVDTLLPFDKAKSAFQCNFEQYIDIENGRVTVPGSDDLLNDHLSHWLFPKSLEHGWYKAKNKTATSSLVAKKLMAIYNEKHLSACAENSGITLISVYSNPMVRKVNHLLNRWLK